jgi:hypothetical protein
MQWYCPSFHQFSHTNGLFQVSCPEFSSGRLSSNQTDFSHRGSLVALNARLKVWLRG